ncbi:hypothetical protein ACFQJD_13380 [Haloplanus sp. GCM10025708]|uniref:hypothetical protein n=1 Tax=Haloplanus sp. GCM10025708 TaxID=3252679 RepID=UPI003618272A
MTDRWPTSPSDDDGYFRGGRPALGAAGLWERLHRRADADARRAGTDASADADAGTHARRHADASADADGGAPEQPARNPSVRLLLRLDRFESAVYVDFEVRIENVSRRVLEFVEYRVDVRYDAPELSRTVATDYFSRRFPEGLEAGETARLTGTAKFVRDGRAERSTDEDDFALEFAFREVDFR